MAQAQLRCRSADRSETAELNRAVDRGGGDCRRVPSAHAVATLKEATVNRYHYDTHEQLRAHLADFVMAYNFARRLKILKGLSPYEYICNAWSKEPARFILDPIQQMPGLNT